MTRCKRNTRLTQEGLPVIGSTREEAKIYRKTKMCKFHQIGQCMRGNDCAFAHHDEEVLDLPDLSCTKLCRTLLKTGTCQDPNCTYAHTDEELRETELTATRGDAVESCVTIATEPHARGKKQVKKQAKNPPMPPPSSDAQYTAAAQVLYPVIMPMPCLYDPATGMHMVQYPAFQGDVNMNHTDAMQMPIVMDRSCSEGATLPYDLAPGYWTQGQQLAGEEGKSTQHIGLTRNHGLSLSYADSLVDLDPCCSEPSTNEHDSGRSDSIDSDELSSPLNEAVDVDESEEDLQVTIRNTFVEIRQKRRPLRAVQSHNNCLALYSDD